MKRKNQAVFEAALNLPEPERLRLVEELLESLPPAPDSNWEEAWGKELERRIEEVRQGKDSPISWAELKNQR